MYIANYSVKFLSQSVKIMSESNYEPVSSYGISDPTFEVTDKNQLSKISLTKLLGEANRKLKFLEFFDDRINPRSKSPFGVQSEACSIRHQHPCQNSSYKSLTPLGTRDSLENVIRIRRYAEFPQKNVLQSFVRANNLEKHPRYRLCRNKVKTITMSNVLDPLKSQTYPEINVKSLRYQLANEKRWFNRFNIGKFGHKIRNQIREAAKGQLGDTLHRDLFYEKVIASLNEDDKVNFQISPISEGLLSNRSSDVEPVVPKIDSPVIKQNILDESYFNTEMFHSLEKFNLNQVGYKAAVRSESVKIPRQARDTALGDDIIIKKQFNYQVQGCFKERSGKIEDVEDDHFVDLHSCTSKVDFSSGDDSRNLSLKSTLHETGNVCKMIKVGKRLDHQKFDSRKRSVQWNSEVDVIYYAEDIDGDRVIHREMEPLCEEADQQARHNSFVKLALNKNLISALSIYKFLDPWITIFYK